MSASSSPSVPPLRAIIVDDEPPARALVDEFLSAYDAIDVVGSAGSVSDAVDCIDAEAPDLVFLDVQMPDGDGFDVLEQIDTLPDIIFSTAYDEYAIQAFETGAVDYLLKPYKRSRFDTAVGRVLARHDGRPDPNDANPDREPAPSRTGESSDYADRIADLLQAAKAPGDAPERLYVRHGGKIIPVELDDVLWIKADGDYSELHTQENTFLSSKGIGELAERLDERRFARVHRSHIISLGAVDHLRSDDSGGYVARLVDGTRLRVSRSYAPEIRDRIV
ncbi:LytR/AlgR family response regulator transcription factor [Longibacter sp.]|uniref:LytR/AlgR family response regulator transcription factor n=1 Tax=Longibacter sp. TaxID=2045415 RepID=UPI003EBD0173